MECPEGYKTKYDILREECKNCLTKVCLVPAVSNEIGEWFPYFLDELEHFKGEFISMADELRMNYMHGIGRILEEGLSKAQKKYGEKIIQEAAKRVDMGLTKCYEALNFYRLYPDIKQCPASRYSQVKKLIESKGDVKVLSQECFHREIELIKRCKKCGKVVK
jgi:hypothetical protein